MENPYYLGIDLSDSYAMVSFYELNMSEPETVSLIAGSENYHIPTLLARRKNVGMWYYGDEAQKMAKTSEVICVDSLLRRAVAEEADHYGGSSDEREYGSVLEGGKSSGIDGGSFYGRGSQGKLLLFFAESAGILMAA